MPCEILACCQFFEDHMKEMPIAADYIKKKLCLDNNANCIRYRAFKRFDGETIPADLYSDNSEQLQKIVNCLHSRQLSG